MVREWIGVLVVAAVVVDPFFRAKREKLGLKY
jgi:hypothetical protein